jgi:hypothetical protein
LKLHRLELTECHTSNSNNQKISTNDDNVTSENRNNELNIRLDAEEKLNLDELIDNHLHNYISEDISQADIQDILDNENLTKSIEINPNSDSNPTKPENNKKIECDFISKKKKRKPSFKTIGKEKQTVNQKKKEKSPRRKKRDCPPKNNTSNNLNNFCDVVKSPQETNIEDFFQLTNFIQSTDFNQFTSEEDSNIDAISSFYDHVQNAYFDKLNN